MESIRRLRNEAEYEWALAEIAHYFEKLPALGTMEADRFDLLTRLLETYETEHWPIEPMVRPAN